MTRNNLIIKKRTKRLFLIKLIFDIRNTGCWVFLHFFAFCPANAISQSGSIRIEPSIELSISSEIEPVYIWRTDRCSDEFIPDSPARAFRRTDGTLVVIAAHYTNSVLEGSSFSTLRPNCAIKSSGSENPDPRRFDDRFWIQGLLSAPDGKIVALLSHEYQGKRHPGHCAYEFKSGPQCWYSSILLGTGSESDFFFSILPNNQRIVATPPTQFDPTAPVRTGFFTTTNIVRWGDYAYFFAWAEIGRFRGNCLFRSYTDAPIGPWVALRDGEFQQSYTNPYATDTNGERCDAIGAGHLEGVLRSVVWLEKIKTFVGVFSLATNSSSPPGIYYVTSPDLIEWSEPKLLFHGRPWYGTNACGEFFDYPSLIDHHSKSREFSTADDDIFLYLTRFNWNSCHPDLNRDLVRLKITIERPDVE